MKKHLILLIVFTLLLIHVPLIARDQTIVEKWGQLRVEGIKIVNQQGDPVALRGMSMYWSQWVDKYYNDACIEWLKEDWQCTVVRAAMAVGSGGYLSNPETEMAKVETVIEACLDVGIYVIVDWHDHEAENHVNEAIEFFTKIADYYGDEPNLIYEIYNEPLQVSWSNEVKPYADTLVAEIRAIDPDNIIIIGTPTWSQDVDVASKNPVEDDNVAYALHFYSGTHTQWLRNKAVTAMNNGVALFASEWGTTDYTGNGPLYFEETQKWLDFMDEHLISWCNWSLVDLTETSAALNPGASASGGWSDSDLSESGKFVRGEIIEYNESIFTSADENKIKMDRFDLIMNYPNPFNGITRIEFLVPVRQHVKINVFNGLGQKVVTLIDETLEAGIHQIPMNLYDLPSGMYLYQCYIDNTVKTGRMQFVK